MTSHQPPTLRLCSLCDGDTSWQVKSDVGREVLDIIGVIMRWRPGVANETIQGQLYVLIAKSSNVAVPVFILSNLEWSNWS